MASKRREAAEILRNYNGKNDYILKLKKKVLAASISALSSNQIKYVVNNHDKDPIKLNKIIDVSEYVAESYKEKYNLQNIPTRILVEEILSIDDLNYHIKVRFYRNQKYPAIIFLPKTQVFDDILFEEKEFDIDFGKYSNMDRKGRTPYEHQKYGVNYLLNRNGCILGDDQGLGKTYQSIIAALESGAEKILIICPASLKVNWKREIEDFCEDVEILRTGFWDPNKFTIINYDILDRFHTIKESGKEYKDYEVRRELVNHGFDTIIIDEAHYIKNPKANRTKIVKEIVKQSKPERLWLLTGTPISNKVMDFFPLLDLIKAPVASDWVFYARRYCDGKNFRKKMKGGQTRMIWITDGASNLEELGRKTKNIILRRLKEDVLDLPDKIITPYYVELDEKGRKDYDLVYDEYVEWKKLEGKRVTSLHRQLVELTLLRKFIARKRCQQQ